MPFPPAQATGRPAAGLFIAEIDDGGGIQSGIPPAVILSPPGRGAGVSPVPQAERTGGYSSFRGY